MKTHELKNLVATCERILEKATGHDLPLSSFDYQELMTATETAKEAALEHMTALCQAAGVDPATLEDGPEALHDAIVLMRQDAVRRVEYDDVVDKCESLARQLGRAEKAWAMWLDRWTHLEDLARAARERGTGVDLEDALESAERSVK
jgi:hypothetical protein